MLNDLTVVYYTSNTEIPTLEKKVINTLVNTIGNIPLISVSQKPMDLGKNICVGDIGRSSQNAFRQFYVGIQEAKTKYVCPTESDFLYPREYFEFDPPDDKTIFSFSPVYVIFTQRGKSHSYCYKGLSEAAIMASRDILLAVFDKQLEGRGMWSKDFDSGGNLPHLFDMAPRKRIRLSTPIITFKTDNNMHRKTPLRRGIVEDSLPYWGESRSLVRKYLEN